MQETFLSIVIPAYNEEHRLPGSLKAILDYLGRQSYTAEVIVADDGSADGTAKAAEAFAGGATPVRVLRLAHRGKGHAVKQGMLAAKGQWRFQCDADLAMPIEQAARFLPPALTDAEIGVGSREAPGAKRYNEPWHRHAMGRIFNGVIRLTAVPKVQDTQCGFKIYKGEAAERLFTLQRLDGFAFDVEIFYLARKMKLRMKDVAIDWRHNRDSRIRAVHDTLGMLSDIARIRWSSLRGRYRIKG